MNRIDKFVRSEERNRDLTYLAIFVPANSWEDSSLAVITSFQTTAFARMPGYIRAGRRQNQTPEASSRTRDTSKRDRALSKRNNEVCASDVQAWKNEVLKSHLLSSSRLVAYVCRISRLGCHNNPLRREAAFSPIVSLMRTCKDGRCFRITLVYGITVVHRIPRRSAFPQAASMTSQVAHHA